MRGAARRGLGWVGLAVSLLLWVLSILALLEGVQANEAAARMTLGHARLIAGERVEHLRGVAVTWCLALTGLQLAAGLVATGVLRGVYRLRTAVCFAVSGGSVIALNTLWLLGVLVWLRIYGDTR